MSLPFGEILKAARNNAGLTQQQLADMIGVKRKQIISNWEKGIVEPNIDTLLRLADCLDVSLDNLLDRSLKRYKQMALDSGIPAVNISRLKKRLGLMFSYGTDLEDFIYLLLYKSFKDSHTPPHIDDEDFEEISKMGLPDESIEVRLKAAEKRDARERRRTEKSKKQ
jgi:transcriptional regulator with XRE-family HTH domain